MEDIIISGPLKPNGQNQPTRKGERISSLDEIQSIPNPYVGMSIYVEEENATYKVLSLADKTIGGVVVPNAIVGEYEKVPDVRDVEELVLRLQGDSEESSAFTDPFKNLGNFAQIGKLEDVLDTIYSIDVTDAIAKTGYYRATVGVRTYNIVVLSASNAFAPCCQVISGMLSVEDGVLKSNNDSAYGIAIRYLNSPANVVEYWGGWEILSSLENNKEIENAIATETERAQAEEQTIRQLITDLVGESPETLDTIHEISSWILNDENGAAAMAKQINANADAIATETERAIIAENELESEILSQTERIDNIEPLVAENARAIIDLQHSVQDKDAEYRDIFLDLHDDIEVEVTRAEGKEKEIVNNIENGSIIAGQAREVYSLQGKADSDEFLVRTQGGDATIGNGVAEIRQISGNIVKNIHSLSDTTVKANSQVTKEENRIIVTRLSSEKDMYGISFVNPTYKAQTNHKYYSASLVYNAYIDCSFKIFINNYSTPFTIGNGWHLLSAIRNTVNVVESNDILQCLNAKSTEFIVANHVFIDLTEMYGAGNEPTLDECDKLFAATSYLPSGINVASPVTYESVGYNQCDVSKSMTKKHVFDSEIVDGANTLVVMPCLPCKLGVGENNGYIIGNGEGDEWSETAIRGVFFTMFNPLETSGKLYLKQLTKTFCELCDGLHKVFLPPCAGYIVIETTSTDKLCAKFAWSGDRDYRDYEPYIKTEVKLPQLTQMSEWGLAGITASGTAARDTIDLENKKYIKRIGRVNLGELSWRYSDAESTNYGYSIFSSAELKGRIKNADSGKFGNILTLGYTIAPASALTSKVIPNKCIMLYINGALYIRDDAYTSVAELTAALSGQYLYFELETPEEHDIEVSSNSYIADDYGVERFNGSSVPIVANQLFYKRSIVGETKNFLDRLMARLGTSDATAVADKIADAILPQDTPTEGADVEPTEVIEE